MSNIQSDDFYYDLRRFFATAVMEMDGAEDKLFEMMDVLGSHVRNEYVLWTLMNDAPRSRIVEDPAITPDPNLPPWQQREKIRAIKAVRAAMGLGLKEAKDAVEGSRDISNDMRKVRGSIYRDLVNELRESGYTLK